ncbi:MAG: AmmeMemoRadiSam system radical SAM enzyme [Candidatus Saganbacteria bacterium]|nr:AmmeMemoRadiSam system radical SAM enzyme [Candidatus Saganbacteria bacterium]
MQNKEALFYEKLQDKKVQCHLCPWECVVLDGKIGVCGVRKNEDGKLYTLIYGVVSSLALDPIEKKPLFHFYPGSMVMSVGTFGCNMKCGHCQNWEISGVRGLDIGDRGEEISPNQLIEIALEKKAAGIAWTYNEPSIWFEYTLDCAKFAKEKGLYTVFVTNGYINKPALDAIGPYLDAFCVDIKAFSPEAFKKLTKAGHFEKVLEATEYAKKRWNMHIEVITNVVPTVNDDNFQLKGIADWIKEHLGADTPWHVTRFIPYHEFKDLPPTPVKTLEKARKIGMDAGLNFVYIGNVSGHPGENTYCPKCKKLLIERAGFSISQNHTKDHKCGFCNMPLLSFKN